MNILEQEVDGEFVQIVFAYAADEGGKAEINGRNFLSNSIFAEGIAQPLARVQLIDGVQVVTNFAVPRAEILSHKNEHNHCPTTTETAWNEINQMRPTPSMPRNGEKKCHKSGERNGNKKSKIKENWFVYFSARSVFHPAVARLAHLYGRNRVQQR